LTTTIIIILLLIDPEVSEWAHLRIHKRVSQYELFVLE
jgi:hypothetical protein